MGTGPSGPEGWWDLGSRPRLTLSLTCLEQSSHLGSEPRGGRLAQRLAPEPSLLLGGQNQLGDWEQEPQGDGRHHGENHAQWASPPL